MNVYRISVDSNPGREITGGKAASLFRMTDLGLDVPPAFVVSADVCAAYIATGELPSGVRAEIAEAVHWLEGEVGRSFGGDDPLLVSVRSGAAISMPGMMDTVLNLGINGAVAATIAKTAGEEYAAATLERFRSGYRDIVLGDGAGPVPDDPWEQLLGAIGAVFASWNTPRAQAYRRKAGISDALGTAVTVQAMVFGHRDERSGTGVVFSRDPLTGEPIVFGEWLAAAQGEALVGGEVNAQPIATLADTLPDVHAQLMANVALLEQHGRDIQDIEFTVESGKLWMLQSRSAKRSALAAARAAVDMVGEGLIDERTALRRVTADQVRSLGRPVLSEDVRRCATVLAQGEAASPGVGIGQVFGTSEDVEDASDDGTDAVLARASTSPDDFVGMSLAVAVITEAGGTTSHAAVVSRELGVPAVVGCGPDSVTALVGRVVTVDGTAGAIYDGALPLSTYDEATDPSLQALFGWAREQTPVPVYSASEVPDGVDAAPADSATEVVAALAAGAKALVTTGRRLPILLEVLAHDACQEVTA